MEHTKRSKRRTHSDREAFLPLGRGAWTDMPAPGPTRDSRGYRDLLREIELTGGLAYGHRALAQVEEREHLPEVLEVFFITNAGLLVERFSYTETTPIDADIFSAMLKAVQCFVEDSFGSRGALGLKELRMGNLELLLTQGRYLTLIVMAKAGGELKLLEPAARLALDRIESENRSVLKTWYGDRNAIKGLKEVVEELVKR